MNALTSAALVHFYDTRSHEIACGVGAFEHRSTKHPRQVTCHACVALLGDRASGAVSGSSPPAGAAP